MPFAHAKVGYRQAIFKRKSPASKEDRAFLFSAAAYVGVPPVAFPPRSAVTVANRGYGLILEILQRIDVIQAMAVKPE